ncbi:cell division protein FtsQ [Ketogulonicigenium robustum]|uniref:Cell division protein FtsQ n=1 Tax=Ketogulonicigenium robustum TaxID=92947 RepID=A0A1W6P0T6_9RHOB|nr:cell division protein FtsQ/DivIB [Ketogulonicigenium robustum]ARO14940.1 cell division protein FtsQ [Ketogulonicigenium robustum]
MRPVIHRKIARETRYLRRDPAPSRWSYRYQRLMLTPMFRLLLRIGIPVVVLLLVLAVTFGRQDTRAWVQGHYNAAIAAVTQRPEFMVNDYAITGASPDLAYAVEGLVDIPFPISTFNLDLRDLRARISALSPVKQVSIQAAGGTLQIAIEERQPVAVWRHTDGLRLMDGEGIATGMIMNRADRHDLPLIAGDGAQDAIPEAMELFRIAAPLGSRVLALVRMGERRWDLMLDRDQRIQLPEEGAVEALQRVIAQEEAQQLLSRDVSVVDLRNAARQTIRLTQGAREALRGLPNRG